MEPISLWLITAHLLADFPLQPDWMASQKLKRWWVRLMHVLVHFSVFFPVAVVIYGSGVEPVVFLLWVTASHFAIDSRRWVEPKEHFPTYPWVVDQILHLLTLSFALPVVDIAVSSL